MGGAFWIVLVLLLVIGLLLGLLVSTQSDLHETELAKATAERKLSTTVAQRNHFLHENSALKKKLLSQEGRR